MFYAGPILPHQHSDRLHNITMVCCSMLVSALAAGEGMDSTLHIICATHVLLASVAIGFILAVVFIWKPRLQSKKPVQSIPMLPNSHWLFGHLFWLLRNEYLVKQQILLNNADDQGRCSCWIGAQPSISLTSRDDAQKLLRNHHTRCSAPILKHHFEMLAGKRNLLLLNGKEWKYYQSSLKAALYHQTKADPTLLQRITVQTTRTLVKNIQAKINESSSDRPNQIYSPAIDGYMKMITQDVFGVVALSHHFGCCANLQLSNFAKAFESIEDDILDRCLRNTLLPQNLIYSIPTKRNKMFLDNRRYLRSFLKDIIHDRLDKRHAANITSKCDILDKLIETHVTKQQQQQQEEEEEEEENQNSEEDLVDVVLSVLLAGYDTVTIALTYAVFLVSCHPYWEERCLEEVRRCNNNFDDVHNLLAKLEYPLCRAVIFETLRLYPVATALSRSLEKPLQLGKTVTIPEKCHVGISVWSLHRSEKHFPRPLEFRPDRWVRFCSTTQQWIDRTTQCEQEDCSIPVGDLNSFLAFSSGARSCPGQSFAIEEASLAFAVLIDGLKFVIDSNYQPEMEWKVIVQKPKGGIPVCISIR
jgi:cytochrome P450